MNRRDRTIGAAVSPAELERVRDKASELDVPVSVLLRQLALAAAEGNLPLGKVLADE